MKFGTGPCEGFRKNYIINLNFLCEHVQLPKSWLMFTVVIKLTNNSKYNFLPFFYSLIKVCTFWLLNGDDLWFHNIALVINRYMSTLGNKKLELFDPGAGSSQPMAEENVQLASGRIFLLITLILGNMVSWCRFLVYSYAYAYLIGFYVYFSYLLHAGHRNFFHL